MFLILVVFSWICVYNMKIAPVNGFNTGYLSRRDTTAVKGIFVLMVFMSHFTQYYRMSTAFDNPYNWLKSNSGQTVVVMFLLYSGYGIYESVKKKGTDYIKSFPKNRCLKTLLHLDAAVLIYLVFDLLTGQKVTLPNLLLSFVAWKGIGNSNWFMFLIIVQYVLVFISFTVFRKKKINALILETVLSVLFMVVVQRFKQPWWYNTALCFPLGMWFSFFKDKIEKAVMKNNITYAAAFAVTAGIFLLGYLKRREFVFYEIWMLTFALVIVLVTMKVSFGNKVLEWLGNHVFSIYIFQRIPMIFFEDISAVSGNRYLYFAVCFIITLVISGLFDKVTGIVDGKIFPVKSKA